MAVELLAQSEAIPAAYPDAGLTLSTDAAALNSEMIWQRIEAYTAHRFTPRAVLWTVEGMAGDEWKPPLAPVVAHTAERWASETWQAATMQAGPVGLVLPSSGVFKITATVGAGPVPRAVAEAFGRLAEYMADDPGRSGASASSESIGPMQTNLQRSPAWLGRAMQFSGAADLLRPYRRA